MKIAIASQNRRTTTAHAGKCTHFWVVDSSDGSCVSLQLNPDQMLSQAADLEVHPLSQVDVLLAASAGQLLAQRLACINTVLALTKHSDPQSAASAWLDGEQPLQLMPGKGRCQLITGRT